MKKLNKFLSLALLFSISFNQASFCMQKTEEIINLEELSLIETTKLQNIIRNLGEIDQTVLKDLIFEHLKLNDFETISASCKILNKLVNNYMEDPAIDSKRQINVNLRLTEENISFFKKISKNFEQMQNKLKKFIDNSDRTASLKLHGHFTGIKSINLNKENIADLKQTLLKFFSINKKNLVIGFSKKLVRNSKIIIPILCLICYGIPLIICLSLNSNNFNIVYKILIWIVLVITISILIIKLVILPLERLKYDLSMTDKADNGHSELLNRLKQNL